jgi:hypothetical protein
MMLACYSQIIIYAPFSLHREIIIVSRSGGKGRRGGKYFLPPHVRHFSGRNQLLRRCTVQGGSGHGYLKGTSCSSIGTK